MPETPLAPSEIQDRLAAPFPADAVGWKPQAISGSRALAVAYIDARDVMDRLDSVLGLGGWQDAYTPLPDGAVVCRLSIRLGPEWVHHEDVGGESEQPDEGDRRKAAFSDALKRAAVKFGIGRYLYRLPAQWCDYDPQKKQFVRTPTLPPSALPLAAPKPPPARISPEQVTRLNDVLAAKGRDWPRLRHWLELPGHARITDVSPEDYDRALKALGEEPDAPARKQ